MKNRKVADIILQRTESPFGRIIILTGARQVGKTTLAKKLFANHKYISIEDPVLRMEYKKLTAAQWRKEYPKAILDEIQKEPILIESIKSVYDQFKEPRYVLLGSSQILLLQKVKETLAGRCSIFEIFPLTLPEIRSRSWQDPVKFSVFQSFGTTFKLPPFPGSFKLDKTHAIKSKALKHYLEFGGYPAIVDEEISNTLKYEWLENYVKTYLERDVRDLADFKNLDPFLRIQQISALLTAQLVNYNQLGKEAGVVSKTAQRFLHYLEISYQTILIPAWHRNELKRLMKSPKLHYLDPGIQRSIIKKRGVLNGHEFESAVVAELYKQAKVVALPCRFYHLRTFDGREVDLILEFETGYVLIEIKMAQRVTASDARCFNGLEEILDKPILYCFLLSNDEQIQHFAEKIIAMPVACFLG